MAVSKDANQNTTLTWYEYEILRIKKRGFFYVLAWQLAYLLFWVSPKLILEPLWLWFYHSCSYQFVRFHFQPIWHTLLFVVINLGWMAVYKFGTPFLNQFRAGDAPWPWEQDKEKWKRLKLKSFIVLGFNHFIVTPGLLAVDFFMAYKGIGSSPRVDDTTLPSSFEILWQIIFCLICEDFAFYWSHRLLHNRRLYSRIHKIHHEYTGTIGIAAEFAHPIEFTFGNVVPALLGPKLLGSRAHMMTVYFWVFIRLAVTFEVHSGYNFPWSPLKLLPFSSTPEYHDFHHSHNVGNFASSFYFWDYICGTNRRWFRHITGIYGKEKKE